MPEFPPPIRLFGEPPAARRLAGDGRPLLSPPFSPARDHVEGPVSAGVTVVVFGAFGTPASRPLGRVIDRMREDHMATVRIAWRHFPDGGAHPRAVTLALAAEAAAARGRFWALTRERRHMLQSAGFYELLPWTVTF